MTSAALASTSAADFNQSGTARDSRDRFTSGPANRADFSETGSGSFLAHNQRMGYRALRLDYVRCISHFGTELCGLIRDAEIAAAWKPGPHGTRHTPDLRDWRDWGGNIHHRSYAASLPPIHQGHTSRNIRHQPVGTASICSAPYQPQPGSQQRSLGDGAASSTLERWLTVVWLLELCCLLRYFCVSIRTGRLWPRR